ncbi:MAG: porin [Acidobacteria bacterium]|nr:MAG: porin [Acidobacteriota bacterium]
MQILRKTFGLLLGLSVFVSSPVWVCAQSQTNNPGDAKAADFNRKVEELQKKIDALQSELQELKNRQSETVTAPAPSVAKTDPPAATTGTAQPIAAAPASATPTPQVAPSATPLQPTQTTLASLLGSTTFSGFVDGYYGYNFDHPQIISTGGTVLAGNGGDRFSSYRAFDAPYQAFTLNMIELIADKPPDASNSRLGYHVSLGFGNAMNVVNATDPGGLGFAQYLKEGYFSYLAPVGKGLQLDFGKFVTQHGAEVIESKDNWNYSRGLLFSYAIPFYHFGLRSKYVINDKYNFSVYVVNGWNNLVNNNTGATLGLQLGWNPTKKWTIVQNYMVGPEENNNTSNIRELWDTVVTYNATSKLSLMGNFDYGRGDRTPTVPGVVDWTGGAGYVRYAFNDRYALGARYEYYDDPQGFTTGTAQHLNEFTGTFERIIAHHLITRLEFRRDMSNVPSFLKGSSPIDNQNTVAMGLVYAFDSKEAH